MDNKKLLLHSCCAPCTSGVLPQLSGLDITLLFYNPNIDTLGEYNRRLDALYDFVKKYEADTGNKYSIVAIPYNHDEFTSAILGLEGEPEGWNRCTKCIDLRLSFTAKYALTHGYDLFASTLSVSPHKNHELINAIGARLQGELGIEYMPSNFKKNNGFLMSVQNSKKYGIYRQRYCGCTPNAE